MSTGNETDSQELALRFLAIAEIITGLICYPIACIVGLITNGLCLLVFLRPDMRGGSTNAYLATLALADMFKLANDFVYTPGVIFKLVGKTDAPLPRYYPIGYFLNQSLASVTAWLTVAVAMERFLLVLKPVSSRRYLTLRKAQIECCVIFISLFILNLPGAFRFKPVYKEFDPSALANATAHLRLHGEWILEIGWFWQYETFRKGYTIPQTIIRSILPISLLLVLNITIIVSLRRRYHWRQRQRTLHIETATNIDDAPHTTQYTPQTRTTSIAYPSGAIGLQTSTRQPLNHFRTSRLYDLLKSKKRAQEQDGGRRTTTSPAVATTAAAAAATAAVHASPNSRRSSPPAARAGAAGCGGLSGNRERLLVHHRVTIMLVAVMGGFVLLASPDAVLSLLGWGYYDAEHEWIRTVREITDCLLVVNSNTNFFLYYSLNPKFRAALTRNLNPPNGVHAKPAVAMTGGDKRCCFCCPPCCPGHRHAQRRPDPPHTRSGSRPPDRSVDQHRNSDQRGLDTRAWATEDGLEVVDMHGGSPLMGFGDDRPYHSYNQSYSVSSLEMTTSQSIELTRSDRICGRLTQRRQMRRKRKGRLRVSVLHGNSGGYFGSMGSMRQNAVVMGGTVPSSLTAAAAAAAAATTTVTSAIGDLRRDGNRQVDEVETPSSERVLSSEQGVEHTQSLPTPNTEAPLTWRVTNLNGTADPNNSVNQHVPLHTTVIIIPDHNFLEQSITA